MSIQRKNKGAAWSWLKSELVVLLGPDTAKTVLSRYYDLLQEEYKDRVRVAAPAELERLRARMEVAKSAGNDVEVRKLGRMIERRLSVLE
jgi:hypothetical protein